MQLVERHIINTEYGFDDIIGIDFHVPVIYKIVNKINDKIYIGQAQNMYKRFSEYRKLRASKRLLNSIKKYGLSNFKVKILEIVDDINKLNEREQYWMDYYNSYDENIGYNICKIAGTTRGRSRTQEEKTNLSNIMKGKYQKENNPFYGRTHSEETKKLMSLKKIGNVFSQETMNKFKDRDNSYLNKQVVQINKDTNEIIHIYSSLSEVCAKFDIKISSLSAVLNKRPVYKNGKQYERKTLKGFKWEFVQLDEVEG